MWRASGEARKRIGPAMSSAVATRRSGIPATRSLRASRCPPQRLRRHVGVHPARRHAVDPDVRRRARCDQDLVAEMIAPLRRGVGAVERFAPLPGRRADVDDARLLRHAQERQRLRAAQRNGPTHVDAHRLDEAVLVEAAPSDRAARRRRCSPGSRALPTPCRRTGRARRSRPARVKSHGKRRCCRSEIASSSSSSASASDSRSRYWIITVAPARAKRRRSRRRCRGCRPVTSTCKPERSIKRRRPRRPSRCPGRRRCRPRRRPGRRRGAAAPSRASA